MYINLSRIFFQLATAVSAVILINESLDRQLLPPEAPYFNSAVLRTETADGPVYQYFHLCSLQKKWRELIDKQPLYTSVGQMLSFLRGRGNFSGKCPKSAYVSLIDLNLSMQGNY